MVPRAYRSSLRKGLGAAGAGTESARGMDAGVGGLEVGVIKAEFSRLESPWTWG